MNRNIHDLERQASLLQQCLSVGRRPIGLLLGAGCPMAIRTCKEEPLIPDIAGITDHVKKQLTGCSDIKESFEAAYGQLETDGIQYPTVEDLLSHVRALSAVAGSEQVRGLTRKKLDELDRRICGLIHEVVNKELPRQDTPYHRFALWANAIRREFPVEVFTTNYDLLMEQALEECRVPYLDGFPGAHKPFFDPSLMELGSYLPEWIRLWKLHGSINWYQEERSADVWSDVYRGHVSEAGSKRVIHPSDQKYQESRRMPYLALLDRLRSFLRESNAALVVCGYSFGDEHINDVIVEGLQRAPTAVTFALMFGKVEDYGEATRLARMRPNLNVLARDGGIIRAQRVEWSERDSESITQVDSSSIAWTQQQGSSKFSAEFKLGDFAAFGQFLREIGGGDLSLWEGSTNAQ